MPVDHYENFPVASWLVPARLRPPIEAIYGFARGADDIADEGDLPDAERLRGLDRYLEALDAIEGARAPPAQFARIAEAIRDYGLPIALLRDLIDAFKQDVVKKRYATFAEVMDYSRRSANPVGRLVLHLVGVADALAGRMGLEIRATVAGGGIILDKIEAAHGDVFRHRPVLTKLDWIKILARAMTKTGARP